MASSHDGRLLAAGERDRFAYVYDVASGKLLAKLDHREEETQVLRIRPVVFSPSGRRLASLTRDPTFLEEESAFTLHVFDLSTRNEIIRTTLNDLPRGLWFSPDEKAVEIAFGRRNLRLERFPLGAEELLRSACARVGRNLDETEWERYMSGMTFRRTCTAINPAARVIP
ncbi:MAG: WD40 repeat domain-containing protein [Thermoanaerobaculia bacterium]